MIRWRSEEIILSQATWTAPMTLACLRLGVLSHGSVLAVRDARDFEPRSKITRPGDGAQ